ncbi:MAG: glycoside hydrolase family 30 beta sandwich domain-containing protein [Candidatus Acidiferrales bacterium]
MRASWRFRKRIGSLLIVLCAAAPLHVRAQSVVDLPAMAASTSPAAQKFSFISDGPLALGWGRPAELPRIYFHDALPALFTRTLAFDGDLPARSKLTWLFTGPHAGVTVELTPNSVRVTQRYYDSYGLSASPIAPTTYPEKITREDEAYYQGAVRELTVVMDAHLALEVLLNGKLLIQQTCLFDVSRHQLLLTAPRDHHDEFSGALASPQVGETTVTVTPDEKHQTMLGFGGSPSIPAYAELSPEGKQRYWDILRAYNLLIDREYPMGARLKPDMSNLDSLDDASPHYYGDNFPNGEVSDFAYSAKTIQMGGSVIYEMWNLPEWATKSYTDSTGKVWPHAANPDEYARAVVTYCELAKERTGAPPAIVGIQNEVDQPQEIADQMVKTLRAALDKAGFSSVKIHMADASYLYGGIERAKDLQRDPDAWRLIDYAASHVYDYQQVMANPDLYDALLEQMHALSDGKPYLSTEICVNDPRYQMPSYRVALDVGQLYHKNLTILDSVALLYCWLILDVEQPTFGASRSLLVPDRFHGDVPAESSYELRVLGAYSRHILKGMVRVGAASTNPDLLVSAFDDGKGGSVVVMLNRSVTAQRVSINWAGRAWQQVERTSPYLDNADSAAGSLSARVQVVEPGEIVTISTTAAPAVP